MSVIRLNICLTIAAKDIVEHSQLQCRASWRLVNPDREPDYGHVSAAQHQKKRIKIRVKTCQKQKTKVDKQQKTL